MKSKLLLLGLGIFMALNVSAQNVKFKGKTILIDGKECFTYTRENSATITKIFNLKEDFILSMSFDREEYLGQTTTYISVYFSESKRRFRSEKLSGYYFKPMFKKLIENKVVALDGTVDLDNLDEFLAVYN